MSVCFFVPAADQAGGSEDQEQDVAEEPTAADTAQQSLEQFWQNVTHEIKKVTAEDFKTQALPLARIKKIMKLDEEVKMISAEAPVMFAKAAEIFIHELTLRAWSHTEDNKRRTLQRNDIAMAISKSDQFDFLIDIVPRHEVKQVKRDDVRQPPQQEQVSHQQATSVGGGHQFIIQQPSQLVQHQQQSGSGSSSSGVTVQQQQTQQHQQQQQPVTIVQQIVTSNGEVQQVPIQLTPTQLNLIRLQVQNNPTQPVVIQTQHHQSPQIIQVSSQAAHPTQQVYHLQVSGAQDDS